jgi:hypothetical protein
MNMMSAMTTSEQTPINQPERSRVHRGAIICAILSVLWLPGWYLFAIVAVIASHLALSDIRKTGARGEYLAIAAMVLSYLGIAVYVMVSIAH